MTVNAMVLLVSEAIVGVLVLITVAITICNRNSYGAIGIRSNCRGIGNFSINCMNSNYCTIGSNGICNYQHLWQM